MCNRMPRIWIDTQCSVISNILHDLNYDHCHHDRKQLVQPQKPQVQSSQNQSR